MYGLFLRNLVYLGNGHGVVNKCCSPRYCQPNICYHGILYLLLATKVLSTYYWLPRYCQPIIGYQSIVNLLLATKVLSTYYWLPRYCQPIIVYLYVLSTYFTLLCIMYHIVRYKTCTCFSDAETKLSPNLERSVMAYNTMNKFLASFIEHSSTELDYTVKDKTLLEKIIDMELSPALDKGFFYNDEGKSFVSGFLYGAEWSLLLFDIFLFGIVDFAATNYTLAAVITYFADMIIVAARATFGKKNLARKTLVHERFLI